MNRGPQTIANLWAAEPAKGPRDCEFVLIATVGSSHMHVRSHKGLLVWAYTNKVILDFSRRGKPTDNAAIESFNGRFRDECLNVHWFEGLEDANTKIEAWRQDYNANHPHRALKRLSPNEYARLTMEPAAESR